ncbi:putative transcription factor AS2-LOB family [Lupinus albus]|uniref:Putative transcription factor AS2-LOB family n=1 Tax=Lupinus albus TaxID=3870 RepID=A0A6A4Q7A0_LUPAL|nr:putative transcription factor AS2-LOB family [Lupinus albus]
MTLKGGTTQACAACKYQRRKCTSECLLAPHFPADQPNVFLNVHKLFGVSNIVKILKILEPNQKQIAMDSIIIQSNYRNKYPVHGCCEEICRLQYQILWAEEELQVVYQQLETCRQQQQQKEQASMAIPHTNALTLFDHSPLPQTYDDSVAAAAALPVAQQHSYSNSNSIDYNSSIYLEPKDEATNPLWVQHHRYTNNNNNSIVMQSQFVTSQPLAIQHETVEDYEQMHPLFDAIDDRQSYIYSKEAYESR